MIRKMVLSASVVMMAATAFGAARERAKEEEGKENSRAGVSTSAKTVVDSNTLALRQSAAGEAAQASDVGVILQDLVMNPQAKGIDEAAQPKVDELADRVVAYRNSGKSIDESVDNALNDMGIDKKDLKEKCR